LPRNLDQSLYSFRSTRKAFYIASAEFLPSKEKSEMQKVNIGIVGCGGIAGAHIEGYRDLHVRGIRALEVKATCDVSLENAKSRAEAIGNFQASKPKVYSSLETMLGEKNLDAVDICLPHNLHHTVASQCLEEGFHVIIEKPLGITMRAARIIMDKAEKAKKVVAVAENYRRAPKQRAFWWAIRQGFIGDPRIVIWSATGWGPNPWGWREDKFTAGGSWVFDGGVHWADLDRYQLGKEAVEVVAMTHTFDPVKQGVKVTVDDMTMAIVRHEGDMFSQWLWTRATPGKGMYSHTIYGSKGSLSDDGMHIQKDEGKLETQSSDALVRSMRQNLGPDGTEKLFPKGSTNDFAIELYDFYEAIVSKRKPEVDALEGYKDMAIPLGFYESATVGKPVRTRDMEELRVERYQKEINEKLGI